MTYMIVEKFYPEKIKSLYQRFDEQGRLLPAGVEFIDSWINEEVTLCFQLMKSESREKLDEWVSNWDGYAEFEIVPVISSGEAKRKVFSKQNFSLEWQQALWRDCRNLLEILHRFLEHFRYFRCIPNLRLFYFQLQQHLRVCQIYHILT